MYARKDIEKKSIKEKTRERMKIGFENHNPLLAHLLLVTEVI